MKGSCMTAFAPVCGMESDSQILLEPEVFSVTEKEMLRLEQCRPVFEQLGYEMELLGRDAMLVRRCHISSMARLTNRIFRVWWISVRRAITMCPWMYV
ncbi:MAG: hypothetical protein ACLTDS_04845 [Bianqueaceae bacterium]